MSAANKPDGGFAVAEPGETSENGAAKGRIRDFAASGPGGDAE